MLVLFAILYFMFILAVVFASFFIITRLQKYSINPKFTTPLITVYIVVTITLVLANVILFLNVPFNDLFYNNNLYY
jgi:heme A synthase